MIDAAARQVERLVSNAVVHASSEVEVICRIEEGRATGIEVEVVCRCDDGRWRLPSLAAAGSHHDDDATVVPLLERQLGGECGPAGVPPSSEGTPARRSKGLLGSRQAYGPAEYSMRFRMKVPDRGEVPTAHDGAREPSLLAMESRVHTAALSGGVRRDELGSSFLAEARELLTGQFDEEQAAAQAGQLLVPRVADWCGVWLTEAKGRMRLSRVWHVDERHVEPLRDLLGNNPPPTMCSPLPVISLDAGAAWTFPLVTGDSCQGMLMLGTAEGRQIPDAVMHQVEDMASLLAQAVATARQYSRRNAIRRAVQSGDSSASLPRVPGLDAAVIYEPHEDTQSVGEDFYDLFRKRDGRWCFLFGDVQGKDREAMRLARHMVRFLAREGHGVESVLERLNIALLDDHAEVMAPGGDHTDGPFLTMLYGELEPNRIAGGMHCRLASAGHLLPLKLSANGAVGPAAQPQTVLGIDRSAQFRTDSLDLAPGEVLLCVTDGVTERRKGYQPFDDDDGLSRTLRQCSAMDARAVANHVRQSVHDVSPQPLEDDLAVLVLKASPPTRSMTVPRRRLPSD
ncbi:serine/threonine-protein phosphatase [Streptomyces sp. NBC_01619]|uniref:PP2C family protein-serine/threonine phosphatase n=1 Tax=Streptomyces sp. NBC_01619 TaxID=2975901 RepID=UPI00224F297D|nr:PP2C family protein-serine/threonine phosphatase [Streptomyces sp. NBC_01619]MCX4515843.1 serine/threonine-protein phosphatase [Streptomyces sp. NBC_01619]